MIDNRLKAARAKHQKDIWYPWYPSDYAAKTAHLTAVQDGMYRRLLDHYYLVNGKVVANATLLLRVCRAFDAAEQAAVHDMLAEFFVERDGNYHHERADIELEKRAILREKRAAAGSKGGKQKVANATILPDVCQIQLQPQSQSKKEELQEPIQQIVVVDSQLVSPVVETAPRPASKPISSKRDKGTRWTAEVVPEDWIAQARRDYPSVDVDAEAVAFVNWWLSAAGPNAWKLNWRRTWLGWVGREAKRLKEKSNGRSNGQHGYARNGSSHPLGPFAQLGDELAEIPGANGSGDYGLATH